MRLTFLPAMFADALAAAMDAPVPGGAKRSDYGNRGSGSACPWGRTNGGKTPRPLQRRKLTGSQRARKRGRK